MRYTELVELARETEEARKQGELAPRGGTVISAENGSHGSKITV
jgi:hypothetical protein